MGNRANFVIVKDQDWQLYYSHWAGCRMLDVLIAGPARQAYADFGKGSGHPAGLNFGDCLSYALAID